MARKKRDSRGKEGRKRKLLGFLRRHRTGHWGKPQLLPSLWSENIKSTTLFDLQSWIRRSASPQKKHSFGNHILQLFPHSSPWLFYTFLPLFLHSSHISKSVFDIKVRWRLKSGWEEKLRDMGQLGTLPYLEMGLDPKSYLPSVCPLSALFQWQRVAGKWRGAFVSSSFKLTLSTRLDNTVSVILWRHNLITQ